MRYSAFISYNHRDRKSAAWLHRALETYNIPPRLRGRESAFGPLGAKIPPVFQDREELSASSDLAQSVREALEQAHSLIVICSPNGAKSHWVNEEIRAFTALGRRDHIQCLIVGGEPNASRLAGMNPDLECLPPALFENGGQEPLASDIRPNQDGKAAARLKLLAGIMGIGYDELRNREHQRRQRRLAIVAVASAIGFVAMAGLTIFAFLARADAVRQRDIAREKTATAERTVDFVKSLFEVSDPSEAKGAKITAQEVLDKGAVRIAHSLNSEPNVKADLMTTLSQVYQGLGAYKKGDAIIRQSFKLPVTDEGVRARQYQVLAGSDYRRGDYARSVSHFSMALSHARNLQDPNPRLVAAILAARGDAKSLSGTFMDARRDIQAALDSDIQHLGTRDVAVARDLEALASYHYAANDIGAARQAFERALAIRIPIEGFADPRVSEDLNQLGSLAYFQGDSASAETYYYRALRSDRLVLGNDHPDVAVTTNNLARVMLERREFARAEPLLEKAVAITEGQRDPTNYYLAFLYSNLGLVEQGLGRPGLAEQLLRKAVFVAALHKHPNEGPAMTDLANLLCQKGRADAALKMLDDARPLTQQSWPDAPWMLAWVNNTRGACLFDNSRRAEGRHLLQGSLAVLREHWPRGTLYREVAEQRLAGAR